MGHDADRGREATIRNIVYSKLSAFELSVTRSIIWSIQTVPRRLKRQAPFIVLPCTFLYVVMDWANKANFESHRKNPKDYENDV